MSLIFQSLQKAPADNSEPGDDAGQGAPAVASAPALVVWMRPILIGLALVLFLGGGAVCAVHYLKDRLPSEAVAGDVSPMSAPAAATVRRPIHSPPLMSPETEATAARTRFYPPATQEPQDAPSKAVPHLAMVTPTSADPTPQAEVPVPEPPPAPAIVTVEPRHADGEPAAVDPEAPDSAAEREAAQAARRKAVEKRTRISRLVRQIEEAVAGGAEAGRTGDLLERLARIKGRDNPYVAKLRAYWHLKHRRYAPAETDLRKVIAAHPDDLEAGINLSLIEINNRQYPQALERLKQLRQAHPEDAAVADLIKRLQ